MKIFFKQTNFPFLYPFTISKGTKTHQPALQIALEHMGFRGYGEAPAITYYNITVEKMVEDLTTKKTAIEKFAFTTPDRYWHYLHHLFPENPFLVCALDMAAWDIYGKMRRKPLWELFGAKIADMPATDYTIGIDSIEEMIKKMKEKPWPVYKIKLGTNDDIAIIDALRKHTNAPFRIDANAAWSFEEALEKINIFQRMGIELIEQPLAKENWEDMKRLHALSPLPLFADESCVFEQDVAKCNGYFHGINIKLTKCSGITPAIRMIKTARSLGLKVMLGCMNESTTGTAAIANLAPMADYLDADGPLLLNAGISEGLTYTGDGKINLSGNPGIGVAGMLFD